MRLPKTCNWLLLRQQMRICQFVNYIFDNETYHCCIGPQRGREWQMHKSLSFHTSSLIVIIVCIGIGRYFQLLPISTATFFALLQTEKKQQTIGYSGNLFFPAKQAYKTIDKSFDKNHQWLPKGTFDLPSGRGLEGKPDSCCYFQWNSFVKLGQVGGGEVVYKSWFSPDPLDGWPLNT